MNYQDEDFSPNNTDSGAAGPSVNMQQLAQWIRAAMAAEPFRQGFGLPQNASPGAGPQAASLQQPAFSILGPTHPFDTAVGLPQSTEAGAAPQAALLQQPVLSIFGPTHPFDTGPGAAYGAGTGGSSASSRRPYPDPATVAAIRRIRQKQTDLQAASADGSQVADATPWVKAPSRIPRSAAEPDMKPNLNISDPRQMRRTLSGVLRGISRPDNGALGVLPDGSLVRDMTYWAKAPSRIPRQYESGDYYSNVNTARITANEGGSLLNGYVPRAKGGNDKSGVTIAAGYDLGQHSLEDLRKYNLSEDLIKRLSPYLGLKGRAARDALARQSVRVTRDEANQVNQGAFDSYFNSAARAFDHQAGIGAFARLPWQAQTVIADLWYNMGDLRGKKTKEGTKGGAPVFWRQVTTGDWEGAYGNLLNFTTVDRRLKERAKGNAKLIRDAIAIGTLPSE